MVDDLLKAMLDAKLFIEKSEERKWTARAAMDDLWRTLDERERAIFQRAMQDYAMQDMANSWAAIFDEQIKEMAMTELPPDADETAKAIEEQKAKLEQAEAERIAKIKEQDQMMDKAREAGRD